jgi:hypothetical protein
MQQLFLQVAFQQHGRNPKHRTSRSHPNKCRYTMMWPWRVQATSGATGSAFAIAFANSYGQIGGAVSSQLFNSRYAPRYKTSFGIAMGFIGMAIVMNIITWSVTWGVDVDTRKLKRVRIAAAKRNEAVLDDVVINAGEKAKEG